MTQLTVFEQTLGYAVYNANIVHLGLLDALCAIENHESVDWKIASALVHASKERIDRELAKNPRWLALAGRFRAEPPDGSVRTAPEDSEHWDDEERNVLVAVLHESMLQWRCIREFWTANFDLELTLADINSCVDGNHAYERILGLDCHLGRYPPTHVTGIIEELLGVMKSHHATEVFKGQFLGSKGHDPDSESLASAVMYQRATAFEGKWRAGERYISLDCDPTSPNVDLEAMDRSAELLFEGASSSESPIRFRMLWKSMIKSAEMHLAWKPPEVQGARVSLQPPQDDIVRRCIRVLSMVNELHKAGYQRIRILPWLSPSGCYWRASITHTGNVRSDGYNLVDDDLESRQGIVAHYTSGQGNHYFDWPGADHLNARQLATKFLEAFPKIASLGQGCDWAYAGWLTEVLGHAERCGADGGLIHFIQDWDLEPAYLKRWAPPPLVG